MINYTEGDRVRLRLECVGCKLDDTVEPIEGGAA